MTTIIFYEKPGCTSNTRQKVLLAAAGHTVLAKNLLLEPWSAERLLLFFGGRKVAEWFNRAAPKIKSGEVILEELNAETALALMLADSLLIRRPLLEADGCYELGFDQDMIDAWLGLNERTEGNLEGCPKGYEAKPCL